MFQKTIHVLTVLHQQMSLLLNKRDLKNCQVGFFNEFFIVPILFHDDEGCCRRVLWSLINHVRGWKTRTDCPCVNNFKVILWKWCFELSSIGFSIICLDKAMIDWTQFAKVDENIAVHTMRHKTLNFLISYKTYAKTWCGSSALNQFSTKWQYMPRL